jgi:hypothetical protein
MHDLVVRDLEQARNRAGLGSEPSSVDFTPGPAASLTPDGGTRSRAAKPGGRGREATNTSAHAADQARPAPAGGAEQALTVSPIRDATS